MIYIIDDKRNRQSREFNWGDNEFETLKSFIAPIYNLVELQDRSKEIFKEGNIVMYHESFLDNTPNANIAFEKREGLEKFAENHKNFFLVIFSGSKVSSVIDNNIVHIPVSKLYQNLNYFIDAIKQGGFDLNILLFGENFEIEKVLSQKLDLALDLILSRNDVSISNSTNDFFFRTFKNSVPCPFSNIKPTVLYNKDVSFAKFDKIIGKHLNEIKFDTIYMPLCFGSFHSEFNGLRLATYLRCTHCENQLSNIVLYSFVSIDFLLDSEYFDILKTKNVTLINIAEESMVTNSVKPIEVFKKVQLSTELLKLNLKTPQNYFDEHGIANEWGIFQLARYADIDIDTITDFDQQKLSDLYFRWLIAKNSLETQIVEEDKVVQKKYRAEVAGLKVIGKIDLNSL